MAASLLCLFRDRLIRPMIKPVTGKKIKRKNDNCGLKNMRDKRINKILIGSFINPSIVPMTLYSISFTSFVIRLIRSPFRFSVKKPIGNKRILLYISFLSLFTMLFLTG